MLDEAMYDLVIVGVGPVGATAAALAGRQGMKVLALERSDEVCPHPRAIGFDHEIMRVWQGIGLTEAIKQHLRPYRPTEYRGTSGAVIKRFDSKPPPHLLGWSPSYVFSQPPVERALREAVRQQSRVGLETGADVHALQQEAESVRVFYRGSDGVEHAASARYVLACDGGGSRIRSQYSLKLESLDFDESWLVVDGIVAPEALATLPDVNVQYCEPQRPCTYVVGPGNHRRWEFMLNEGETAATAGQPAFIHQLLSRWVARDSISLWRSAAYRFHALVLATWRERRVFFAGDSAHMTPPFLAQGMCQGIRDAANLIWKLHYVLQGRADAAILNTYQQERAPHVRRTTELARSLGHIICERDLQLALMRDEELLKEHGGVVPVTIRQDLMPKLAAGLLDGAQQKSGSVRGRICPQPRVTSSDGRRGLLDDIAGSRLRLILSDAPDLCGMADGVLNQVLPDLDIITIGRTNKPRAGAGCALRDDDGVLLDWMLTHQMRALLVRPDHYIFGGDDTPQGVRALCERFKHALHSGAPAYAV